MILSAVGKALIIRINQAITGMHLSAVIIAGWAVKQVRKVILTDIILLILKQALILPLKQKT